MTRYDPVHAIEVVLLRMVFAVQLILWRVDVYHADTRSFSL
jgi:hypothetical protein